MRDETGRLLAKAALRYPLHRDLGPRPVRTGRAAGGNSRRSYDGTRFGLQNQAEVNPFLRILLMARDERQAERILTVK
jgi:hypothetical protein